jgi:poly-beta-1,6-N-acetyl-D-glucosamine synthase
MLVDTLIASIAWTAYVVCLVYLLIITAAFVGLMAAAARENRVRARDAGIDDLSTLRTSPFTIPVSVIAPAYNEEVCIVATVQSLLALDYPEYEIIVVNDGSTDDTLRRLAEEFDLEPRGPLYRRRLDTGEVRQIYGSRVDERLIVVDKVNGGKADALNAGLNLARFRYVCGVDADTIYDSDALLKGMRPVMQDPAMVVGVTSQLALADAPEVLKRDDQGRVRTSRHILLVYQLFDYLRAFVWARAAWSRGNYMLCSMGAFMIWRRDVALDLGGFSSEFTCEDIEFTFRVHEHFRAARKPYRVFALADPIGVTEGPRSVRALISQRARWQRVIAETVWHYRRMFCNHRYGTVGFLGMPYYVGAEVLAPFFQLLAILTVPLAAAAGLLDWGEFLQMLAIVALGNGAFTAAAILVQDRHLRTFAAADLAYMLVLAPLELVVYRPLIVWAQCKGTFDFLRGDRRWNKFERNRRTVLGHPAATEPA